MDYKVQVLHIMAPILFDRREPRAMRMQDNGELEHREVIGLPAVYNIATSTKSVRYKRFTKVHDRILERLKDSHLTKHNIQLYYLDLYFFTTELGLWYILQPSTGQSRKSFLRF